MRYIALLGQYTHFLVHLYYLIMILVLTLPVGMIMILILSTLLKMIMILILTNPIENDSHSHCAVDNDSHSCALVENDSHSCLAFLRMILIIA